MKRLALMFAAVTGLLALWGAPALAHNSLVEAVPAKDARLAQPPAEVKLRFLSNLAGNTRLAVSGPAGVSAIGPVTVAGKFLSAPFTASAPGAYTVTYELTSSDGHVVKNSYTFTIDARTPSPAPPDADRPAVMRLEASSPAEAPVTEEKSSDTPWLPYIGGAAVAGLAVGGVIAFLKRRREGQA